LRLPDWEKRLNALVAETRRRPHAFGQWDCLLWSGAVVEAVTGQDHWRAHVGKYKSQVGAYRYLKKLGAKSPQEYLDSLFPVKPAAFAMRGDLVLASDGIPAVCMGAFALSVSDEGMVRVPRSDWQGAWNVE
jgi:hypothetical protein